MKTFKGLTSAKDALELKNRELEENIRVREAQEQ